MILVESKATQDYVRKRFTYEDLSQNEVNEIGRVPSALSEPRGATHRRDNQCSEHAFRFNQIGAMVTEEGGEAHAINVCKLCYNERNVGILHYQKNMGKKGIIGGCRKRKARRNTRSVAARAPLRRSRGASQRVFGHEL